MKVTKPNDYLPVNRSLSQAADYYSRLAPWYDLLASSEKRFIRAGLDLLNPQPAERILEIGFGTGYALKRIIPHLKGGFCAGLDLSPGMAYQTRDRLQRAGLLNKAGLVCSDSLPLPCAGNSFDAVFSSFTLELFDTPHIPILLGEIGRVLKPTGRLVVVSLSKDQPLGLMGKLYERFHMRFPALADCRPIPVRQVIEENGFCTRKIEFGKLWGLPVALLSGSLSTGDCRIQRARFDY